MADNSRINPGTGGDLIAADDITDGGVANGAKVQRVKAGFGIDGAFSDVSAGTPLPVTIGNLPATQPVSDGGGSLSVDDGGGSVTVDGSVSVANWPATQPVSLASAVPVTDNGGALSVDDGGGSLTVDGAVSLSDGATLANVLPGDAGQNSQVIAGARKEVAFSTATAQAVATVDVSNHRWISVHITGQGAGSTVTFQGSNDNVNWVSAPLQLTTSTSSVVFSTTSTGMFVGPANFRYFRLNVTGISGGTTAGVVQLFAMPGQQVLSTPAVTLGGTPVVDTELPAAAALTDGAATPTTPIVGSGELVYNSSTWDRRRSANAAAGTTGTGLAGVGMLGHDGTNYQKAKVDTDGTQVVVERADTATLASVASSATSVVLRAANAGRKGLIIFNESTSLLYVALAATASATAYTWQVPAGGYLELPRPAYTGAISGIWASANGFARVTDLS